MRTFVAGHLGMVGSALVRALHARGQTDLITRTRSDLDLRVPNDVRDLFATERPEVVYLAAARVGGIQANILAPADFLYDNLMIQCNVLHACMAFGVQKVCFLGSSCIYPRECRQPMKETSLLTGPLEPTNEGYAVAKIAGVKLAQYYREQYGLRSICPMPCNLYGPNDSFDPVRSHVLSALVRKFVDAADDSQPEVTIWGSGRARREFLHVDDLARALLLLMDNHDSSEIINVGTGRDVSIRELAEQISEAVGYEGSLAFDTTKPDGMARKCLDVTRLNALGFEPKVTLDEGIRQMIAAYRGLKKQAIRHAAE